MPAVAGLARVGPVGQGWLDWAYRHGFSGWLGLAGVSPRTGARPDRAGAWAYETGCACMGLMDQHGVVEQAWASRVGAWLGGGLYWHWLHSQKENFVHF